MVELCNMNANFDFSKIAVEFLQNNLDKITGILKKVAKSTRDQVRLRLDSTYKDYIETILQRHSKVKSFFIRNEPVHLYKFYIPLGLSFRNKHLRNFGLLDVVAISPFSIITGSAGSGKSMLMRHLLINSLFIKEKIPIFVELRQMNQDEDNLRSVIEKVLFANKFRIEGEYIEKALEAGHFAVFLDGFDEVNLSKRQAIGRQIISFSEKYSDNWLIVSSRPDNLLEGLAGFALFEVDPLDIDQAQELISKLPYDEDIKTKFQEDLGKELFKQHESFLSNPLLLSIMLLTYGQGAHIPNKLNVFYNQAYEALFQRHDALKSGFQRDRCTQLDIQDFAKVFSAFCLQTYDKTEFEFSRMQALKYLTEAKKISQIEYNSEDYLNDALQAVCLLVQDGINIVFAHRSFQEYFTARFIAECKPGIQRRLIEKYSKASRTDTVMQILYEIRADVVEFYYIMPGLEELQKFLRLNNDVDMVHYIHFVKTQYDRFEIMPDEGIIGFYSKEHRSEFHDLIRFILSNCGYLIGWKGFERNEDNYWEKYYWHELEEGIKTKNFAQEDKFVKDLAEKGGIFSMHTLRTIFEIGKILKGRAKSVDESLETILKGAE
jgi:hypothetical protein